MMIAASCPAKFFSYRAFFSNFHTCSGGPPDGSLHYSWWMVILVTPIMLVTTVIHAMMDRTIDNSAVLGAFVSSEQNIIITATN